MTFIKQYLNRPGIVGWLIIANVAMWAVLRLCGFWCMNRVGMTLELPAHYDILLQQPWTVLTYMWVQYDLLHIACNMVMLYYFGSICNTLGQDRYILPTYLCGGVVGALCYIAVACIAPGMVGSGLIGSSAAVIAVGVFAAFTAPRLQLGVWLLGDMQLRWIITGVVMVMCIGALATSMGELFTHLGGVAAGAGMHFLRRVRSLKRRGVHANSSNTMENLDQILDKVKRNGYSSLNTRERKALFDISNKLNHQ